MGKGLPYSLGRGKSAKIYKETIKLRAFPIDLSATGSAIGFGTAVIGDFPEGNVLILGTVANLQVTNVDTDATTTFVAGFALGTAPTADLTLSGAEVNLVAETSFGAATARVSPTVRGALGTPFMVDNTDGSLEINLNMTITAATITDDATASMTVTGEVYMAYLLLGDD